MSRYISLLPLLGLFCTPAHALEVPKGSKYDARIQMIAYNPHDVVHIRACEGLSTEIVFGEDEEILDIASGFTQGWDFINRRNVLYIKPKSIKGTQNTSLPPEPSKWDTNLFVTTNKRLYAFDMTLIEDKARITYRLQFRYPQEEAAKRQAANKEKIVSKQLELKEPAQNWQYTMQVGERSSDIIPSMAYDDGRFTYLKFPNNIAFPAVFVVDEDGKENIIESHVEASEPNGAKDRLVIHRVVKRLNLRLDNKVIGVFNEQYDMQGLAPKGSTTVPGIKRDLKTEGRPHG